MTTWLKVPEPRDLPAARASADAEMLARLDAGRAEPRQAALLGGGLIAALAVTGAGVAYLVPEGPTDVSLIHCHTTTDLGRGDSFIGASLSSPSMNGDGQAQVIEDVVAGCADLWRDGWIKVGSTAIEPTPGGGPYAVPELTACVSSSGVAAVFPAGEEICAQLSLPQLRR